MARPKKQTVDYFPHIAANGKTMFILESQFGNDGYAFWFKLLEMLATTDGHIINCRNSSDWQFLLAKTRTDEVTASKILALLSDLDAIDKELWSCKVIWCQNFVNNIADVYKNRKTGSPKKPEKNSFYEQKPEQGVVSTSSNSNSSEFSAQPTNENPQSKVKETKVNNSNKSDDVVVPSGPSAHDFYQQNFGVENPTISQNIEFWIDDLSEELVIESMRRAALDQKNYKYAEGIMKNWDKAGVKTMDEVKSADVAFENSKKKPSYGGNTSIRKETLPDWAKEGSQPVTETKLPMKNQQRFGQSLKANGSLNKQRNRKLKAHFTDLSLRVRNLNLLRRNNMQTTAGNLIKELKKFDKNKQVFIPGVLITEKSLYIDDDFYIEEMPGLTGKKESRLVFVPTEYSTTRKDNLHFVEQTTLF